MDPWEEFFEQEKATMLEGAVALVELPVQPPDGYGVYLIPPPGSRFEPCGCDHAREEWGDPPIDGVVTITEVRGSGRDQWEFTITGGHDQVVIDPARFTALYVPERVDGP